MKKKKQDAFDKCLKTLQRRRDTWNAFESEKANSTIWQDYKIAEKDDANAWKEYEEISKLEKDGVEDKKDV